jgi:hypothetical protein
MRRVKVTEERLNSGEKKKGRTLEITKEGSYTCNTWGNRKMIKNGMKQSSAPLLAP